MLSEKSFTLIELIIVIGILAILAVVVILVINPVKLLGDARIKSTQFKINELVKVINNVKGFSGQALLTITGSGCSDCVCRDGNPVDANTSCVNQWRSALTKIQTTGQNLGYYQSLTDFTTDSFSSPFLLDENETEAGCLKDTLRSAGPDKIAYNSDDILPSTFIVNASPACSGQ